MTEFTPPEVPADLLAQNDKAAKVFVIANEHDQIRPQILSLFLQIGRFGLAQRTPLLGRIEQAGGYKEGSYGYCTLQDGSGLNLADLINFTPYQRELPVPSYMPEGSKRSHTISIGLGSRAIGIRAGEPGSLEAACGTTSHSSPQMTRTVFTKLTAPDFLPDQLQVCEAVSTIVPPMDGWGKAVLPNTRNFLLSARSWIPSFGGAVLPKQHEIFFDYEVGNERGGIDQYGGIHGDQLRTAEELWRLGTLVAFLTQGAERPATEQQPTLPGGLPAIG